MTASTPVVFGTGPAGRSVATALLDQGSPVRMVNRSGTPDPSPGLPGATTKKVTA